MDANFRLKRKNVSTNELDPGLNRGCAYFVEETQYKEYLQHFVNEKEPVSWHYNVFLYTVILTLYLYQKSTCSRHDAVNLSEKVGHGHAATGIGACVCSRHDMKRPVSVGDLQRGERFEYEFKTCIFVSLIIGVDIATWITFFTQR